MEEIIKNITVGINAEMAFEKFVLALNKWWPKEYTWSGDALKEIRMDAKVDGLCTEIGPYDFRCDWGRVTGLNKNKKTHHKMADRPAA